MEKRCYQPDEEAVAATNLSEMRYLKRQGGQSSDEAAIRICLGRQQLLPSSPDSALDAVAHIKVGSYYEIDHSKLPTNTPDELKLARVIMVSKKSKGSISLRYPSVYSLRAHFSERNRRKPDAKMLPSLDEQYAMVAELAGEILYRRIPPHEIALQRNQWSFWLVVSSWDQETGKNQSPIPIPIPTSTPDTITSFVNVVSKNGLCWYQLKSTGMVRWGRRKRVRFLCRRHLKDRSEQNLSRGAKGEEEEKEYEDDEEEEEEDDDDEGEEEEEKVISTSDEENTQRETRSCKRKSHGAIYTTQKPKKANDAKQNQQIILYNPNKRKDIKNSIERWSTQRYHLAEENMLKILKEKGAVFGKPILRSTLRAEARKLIGDTGLLDHLLKHMAGKLAPGGEERFMRRHNSNGAMEYWLESADLMEIRKEAGVQDPYWTPPPGWKLGDNPNLDPVCARELKELWDEIARLKKCMLETKKPEEDIAILTTANPSVASKYLVHDSSMLLPLKAHYMDLMNRKNKLEEQLSQIAKSLCALEEEMEKIQSTVEDRNKLESAETTLLILGTTPPPIGTEREAKETEKRNKAVVVISDDDEKDDNAKGKTPALPRTKRKAVAATEDKAAKIERLKSGFRICKPQGTFLWPNVTLSPQVVVSLDDLLAIPTPPSAGSCTTTSPHLIPSPQKHRPQPSSTVKPSAERRNSGVAINISATSVNKDPPQALEAANAQNATSSNTPNTTSSTSITTLINLNEVPGNGIGNPHDQIFSGSWSQSHTSPSQSQLTYRRRHHQSTTSVSLPRVCPDPTISVSSDHFEEKADIC